MFIRDVLQIEFIRVHFDKLHHSEVELLNYRILKFDYILIKYNLSKYYLYENVYISYVPYRYRIIMIVYLNKIYLLKNQKANAK